MQVRIVLQAEVICRSFSSWDIVARTVGSGAGEELLVIGTQKDDGLSASAVEEVVESKILSSSDILFFFVVVCSRGGDTDEGNSRFSDVDM